jgi:hypothetical protein
MPLVVWALHLLFPVHPLIMLAVVAVVLVRREPLVGMVVMVAAVKVGLGRLLVFLELLILVQVVVAVEIKGLVGQQQQAVGLAVQVS